MNRFNSLCATDARQADIRADIYSLGCTLYALLTGGPPFREDTVVKVVLAHLGKEPRPVQPLPVTSVSQVEFEDVVFQHQSATTRALDGISFTASMGETIAFVGPSGSGKTTLVKLLVGLYRPQGGDIRYDGFSIEDVDLNQLRERIGLVTQDTQLFSGSIRENLLFVNPNATDEECMAVLKKAACQTLLRRADKSR